jgi:hypothetical protein
MHLTSTTTAIAPCRFRRGVGASQHLTAKTSAAVAAASSDMVAVSAVAPAPNELARLQSGPIGAAQ